MYMLSNYPPRRPRKSLTGLSSFLRISVRTWYFPQLTPTQQQEYVTLLSRQIVIASHEALPHRDRPRAGGEAGARRDLGLVAQLPAPIPPSHH